MNKITINLKRPTPLRFKDLEPGEFFTHENSTHLYQKLTHQEQLIHWSTAVNAVDINLACLIPIAGMMKVARFKVEIVANEE